MNTFLGTCPALLAVDMQHAIDQYPGERSNPELELNLAQVLFHWRERQWPIIHIRHMSKHPDSPYHPDAGYFDFKECVTPLPGETVIGKSEHSAFMGTGLDLHLKELRITDLLISGVLINNSVDATVRNANNLGYQVYLVSELTAAYPLRLLNGELLSAESVHQIFLSNLVGEYCQLRSLDDLRTETTRSL